VIITSIAKTLVKGLIAGLIGLLLAMVGADPIEGVQRFTFGQPSLMSGINLLPALIGLFAVSQVIEDAIAYLKKGQVRLKKHLSDRAIPRWREVFRSWKILLSSSCIGVVVGAIPGAGGSIASFLAYDQAKKMSKTPEKFGTGHPEGIVATESTNNALTGGSLIPMLTLGIPGEAATAVLLGGLMIQGIQPGPTLFAEQGPIIYGLFIAFLIANIFMLLFQWLGIGVFVKVLNMPKKLLMALILVFCVLGVYAVDNDIFNIYLMIGFGVLGYFLNRFGFGTAPVILGLILGPIAEANLRRALLLSEGSWFTFLERPISLAFLVLAGICVVYSLSHKYKNRVIS
jgi:putative tricarboxylic transport membrane protein